MNDREFAALLARLVGDGLITVEQAEILWRDFLDGRISDVQPVFLPDQALEEMHRRHPEIALALLYKLLGDRNLQSLGAISRRRLMDRLQDRWKDSAAQLAQRVLRGELSITEFQVQVLQGLREVYTGAFALGRGTDVFDSRILERIDELLRREAAFLSRLADRLSMADQLEERWTDRQLASRLSMYGGQARAEFFREDELRRIGAAPREGWVVRYEARDDDRTCVPCHNAQGYYLPGQGPMPGQVCRGGAYCRCRRILEYNPAMWQQLTGQETSAR